MSEAFALSDVEVAYGMPIGFDDSIPVLVPRNSEDSPSQAMELVIRQALMRPPCAISFSGGRDSSALLALAVRVARRETLQLPIPVTLRFPQSSAADEDTWQSLVLSHLGLSDWVHIDVVGDRLDAVGPVSRHLLRRFGLVWPFNTHFHAPIIESVPGGSLITGFGGDEIATSSFTARAEQVLARRRRPKRTDILTVGLALSPNVVRRQVHHRRISADLRRFPWLTNDGLNLALAANIGAAEQVPLGWSRVLREAIWRSRYFRACQQNFSLMGKASGVHVLHPFVAPAVLDALARVGGFGGLGSRTAIMRILCGDLLPEALLSRRTKGSFTDPTWTATAKAFATEWDGRGLSVQLVDAEKLRSHWLNGPSNLLSTTLLQAAWLAQDGR